MYSPRSSGRSQASSGRSRVSNRWYDDYPLNPGPAERAPEMLQIHEDYMDIVFGSSTALSSRDAAGERFQASRAEYLGRGVVKALIADHLHNTFTSCGEIEFTAMEQALLDEATLADLCNRLDLPRHNLRALDDFYESTKPAAILFETYIGGLYQSLTPQHYQTLVMWFSDLIAPYANLCKRNYDRYIQASSPLSQPPDFLVNRSVRAPSFSGYSSFDPIARPGTAAPTLGMYSTAGSASGSGSGSGGSSGGRPGSTSTRGGLGMRPSPSGDYIMVFKEYCERRRLGQQNYSVYDNGMEGDFIRYGCDLYVQGTLWGECKEWQRRKTAAKAVAAQDALNKLEGI